MMLVFTETDGFRRSARNQFQKLPKQSLITSQEKKQREKDEIIQHSFHFSNIFFSVQVTANKPGLCGRYFQFQHLRRTRHFRQVLRLRSFGIKGKPILISYLNHFTIPMISNQYLSNRLPTKTKSLQCHILELHSIEIRPNLT